MRTAIVLAGGMGTRLQPYTMVFPKPMLPLGNVPIVEILLHQLANFGFERAIITVRYMAPLFRAFLENNPRLPVRIDIVEELNPLGTAGSIGLVEGLPEEFLVINGDTLTDLNFDYLHNKHASGDATGTVVLAQREIKIDYGVVSFDDEGTLLNYDEKPTLVRHTSTGIYMLSRDCLDLISPGVRLDMPDLLMRLKGRGQRVAVHVHGGYWKDIGRFQDYQEASADFTASPERFSSPSLADATT